MTQSIDHVPAAYKAKVAAMLETLSAAGQQFNSADSVSVEGARCAVLLAEWLRGLHHMSTSSKSGFRIDFSGSAVFYPFYPDIYNNVSSSDYDGLTRLMILAHKHAVRVAIEPHSHSMLRLVMTPRRFREFGEESDACLHHPSTEDLIKKIVS